MATTNCCWMGGGQCSSLCKDFQGQCEDSAVLGPVDRACVCDNASSITRARGRSCGLNVSVMCILPKKGIKM